MSGTIFAQKLDFNLQEEHKEQIKQEQPWTVDRKNKKLILNPGWEICSASDLRLSSNQHVIVKSGRTPDPNRPGIMYSIWNNCDEDENGNPIIQTKKHVPYKDLPRVQMLKAKMRRGKKKCGC